MIILLTGLLMSITSTKHKVEIPKEIQAKSEIIFQNKLSPKELVQVKAAEYNVSPVLMEKIITCESGWDTTVQSKHVYTTDRPKEGVKKGQRELSFGLSQIHLPAHRDITKAQATDPEFAIDFLAKNVAKGKGSMWSCFPKNMKIFVK